MTVSYTHLDVYKRQVLEGYSATGIEVTDTYAKLARERICSELEEAA